jgi:hypothetical protein
MHSQGGRGRTVQAATKFSQSGWWIFAKGIFQCSVQFLKVGLFPLRDLFADGCTQIGELLLKVTVV